jgi:hypothetical protein
LPGDRGGAWRASRGLEPIESRDDLGFAANYLWMLNGIEPHERSCADWNVSQHGRRSRAQCVDVHRARDRIDGLGFHLRDPARSAR